MNGAIEVNLWPLMIFNFCMIVVIAYAGYSEWRDRRDRDAADDAP